MNPSAGDRIVGDRSHNPRPARAPAIRRSGLPLLAGLALSAATAFTLANTPAIDRDALHAHANAQPDAPAPNDPDADTPAYDWDRAAAFELERLALLDLRLLPDPAPGDYRVADLLLARAESLQPAEARIVRRRTAIAIQSGDEAALQDATRRLVRLDPSDTVAQLRLISMRISALQTVEERLAAYDRFLGAQGRVFDVSVRSRLALDAALLAREQGQTERFERYLDAATTLDPTNKQAASLAVSYLIATRPDAEEAILARTVALLMADPIDPNVGYTLARSLAERGAFTQAARFHANARRITLAGQGQLGEVLEAERLILDWFTLGPGAVLNELQSGIEIQRYQAAQIIAQLEADGRPTIDATKPEDIRLTTRAERVRVFAAMALGRQDLVEAAMSDFGATTGAQLAILRDETQRPAGMTAEQAVFESASLIAEQMILHVQSGYKAAEGIEGARQTGVFDLPQLRPVLDAWVAFHEQRYDDARAGFRALFQESAGTQIGLARTAERSGRIEEAAAAYRRVFELAPLTPLGAFSRERYEALTGRPITDADRTERFASIARSVPRWVDSASADPLTFMALRIDGPEGRIGPLEPALLTLTVRNAAPAPLAIGSDRTIPNMFVLSPRVQVGGELIESLAHPEVFEISNRLRLGARESVTGEAWADAGFVGWYRQARAGSAAFATYRAVQAPRMVNGVMMPGVLALSAGTDAFIRRPLGPLSGGSAAVAQALRDAQGERLAEAFASVRALGVSGDLYPAAAEDVRAIAEAISSRYASLSEQQRAMLVLMIPHENLAPGLGPVHEAINRALADEQSPLVLAAALATRLDSPSDPLAEHPIVRADPTLSEFAERLLARASAGRSGYAAAGPDIEDVAPFGGGGELPE